MAGESDESNEVNEPELVAPPVDIEPQAPKIYQKSADMSNDAESQRPHVDDNNIQRSE